MRLKTESHNFLEGGRSFYYRDIFSGLSNEKMSPALYCHSLKDIPASSPAMKNEPPSLNGIPKSSLHQILHYLAMQQIKNPKPTSPVTTKHPYFLYSYYKNFQLISRLKGNALSLLKTQYAKKKRNPE